MSTNTTRLGLTKPSGSASPEEAVDIDVINTNMNLIDQWMGCILVNDGVTPATGDLFDGAIVKEKTSGIIWEARKNGGGTFDKVYVRYPYTFKGNTVNQSVATGTTYTAIGYANYSSGKNSSASQISGGLFVVPVKGIWAVHLKASYTANVTGSRALTGRLNGSNLNSNVDYLEVIGLATALGSFDAHLEWHTEMLMSVGDTFSAGIWQNSGGNLNCSHSASYTLIEPIQ